MIIRLLVASAFLAPWITCQADEKVPTFTPIPPVPEGLEETAKTKQDALFSIGWFFGNQSAMARGFFIDGKGLAICNLKPFCLDLPNRIEANDGTQLPTPELLAIFPARQCALVRFDHRPKAWLQLADHSPKPGTWVAILSSIRDPDPLACPVMNRQENPKTGLRDDTRVTTLSLAAGRNPQLTRIFSTGAPVLDGSGLVVALYLHATPLERQTLYFAETIDGFSAEIEKACLNPGKIEVPVPTESHLYEPIRLDPLSALVSQASMAGNLDLARKLSADLLKKYPDSPLARLNDQELEQRALGPASIEDVERTRPDEDAKDVDLMLFHTRLGFALMASKAWRESAQSFRKAFDLTPNTNTLAAANLGFLHLNLGELDEAERWYRIAVKTDPERIDFVEGLKTVMEAKNDWKTSDALGERVYQLENLYRSR